MVEGEKILGEEEGRREGKEEEEVRHLENGLQEGEWKVRQAKRKGRKKRD